MLIVKKMVLAIQSVQRPNLKNLSRGLNLRGGSNMVVPFKNVLNVLRFKPVFN